MEQLSKLLGYGAIIWAVAFIVASAFVGFKVTNQLIVQGITTLATVITTYFLASSLNVSEIKEIIKYAIAWVIVGLILDVIITTRYTGWSFFSRWDIWLSYILGFVVTLLAVKPEKK